jgi:hypothetical protein
VQAVLSDEDEAAGAGVAADDAVFADTLEQGEGVAEGGRGDREPEEAQHTRGEEEAEEEVAGRATSGGLAEAEGEEAECAAGDGSGQGEAAPLLPESAGRPAATPPRSAESLSPAEPAATSPARAGPGTGAGAGGRTMQLRKARTAAGGVFGAEEGGAGGAKAALRAKLFELNCPGPPPGPFKRP